MFTEAILVPAAEEGLDDGDDAAHSSQCGCGGVGKTLEEEEEEDEEEEKKSGAKNGSLFVRIQIVGSR